MTRATVGVIALLLMTMIPVLSQADMAGEWEVSFTTPLGSEEFTMYVVQEGPRLSGRLTSDAGEFPLRGTADGDEFEIVWSLPDRGRVLQVTFKGKVDGDSLRGTAKLGDRGAGSLSGSRTSR